jgi:uncharacterized protein YcnI
VLTGFNNMKPTDWSGLRKALLRNAVARTIVVLTVGTALALPDAGAAHITALPSFGPAGGDVRLTLDVINERLSHPMRTLTVRVPAGMLLRSAEPLGPWEPALAGERSVTWTGGALAPNATERFSLVVRMPRRAGRVELEAVQGYADGGRVSWQVALTVTPAARAERDGGRGSAAALAAAVGVAVVAASLLVLRRLRRRSLQER